MTRFTWEDWVIGGLCVAIAVLMVGLVAVVVLDSQRPTFDLKRDEWTCTKSEARSHLQPMLVGKVTVMMPMTTTVCVEYRRS